MLECAGKGHDPAGVEATKHRECAVECPACPHPNKNLPKDWQLAPLDKRYIRRNTFHTFGTFASVESAESAESAKVLDTFSWQGPLSCDTFEREKRDKIPFKRDERVK